MGWESYYVIRNSSIFNLVIFFVEFRAGILILFGKLSLNEKLWSFEVFYHFNKVDKKVWPGWKAWNFLLRNTSQNWSKIHYFDDFHNFDNLKNFKLFERNFEFSKNIIFKNSKIQTVKSGFISRQFQIYFQEI